MSYDFERELGIEANLEAQGINSMLIRTSDWDRLRHNFSQAEKDRLSKAITGETICPRGLVIDVTKCKPEAEKWAKLLEESPR